MPLFRVDFYQNRPIATTQINGEHYRSLKEFETKNGRTTLKWYIVSATNKNEASEMAAKLVHQIWGDILL